MHEVTDELLLWRVVQDAVRSIKRDPDLVKRSKRDEKCGVPLIRQ